MLAEKTEDDGHKITDDTTRKLKSANLNAFNLDLIMLTSVNWAKPGAVKNCCLRFESVYLFRFHVISSATGEVV